VPQDRIDDAPSAGAAPGDTVDLLDCLRRAGADRDERAFEALFTAVAPRIAAYMRRAGASPETAEELAQEALMIAWTKAPDYDPAKGQPLAWLFAIARNLRIDRFRKERVWRMTEGLPEAHAEIPADEATPEQATASREVGARVRETLATLPEDQRELVILSYVAGLSHSAIRDRTGLPLGTIKSRLRLAYEKLRPVLAQLR
jgi:RNA polymerase sigma-70 factor (ECF subfamily)